LGGGGGRRGLDKGGRRHRGLTRHLLRVLETKPTRKGRNPRKGRFRTSSKQPVK